MKKYLLSLLIVCCFFACKKEENINSNVVGTWQGTKLTYVFRENGNYYFLNGRSGTTEYPIIADSTFGTFKTNSDKSQITLYQEGYREKETGKIVEQKNQVIWKYTIEGSVMTYSSPTTEGELTKK